MKKTLIISVGNTNIRYGIFKCGSLAMSGILTSLSAKHIKKESIDEAFCISVNKAKFKRFKMEYDWMDVVEIKKKKRGIISEYDIDMLGIDRYMTVAECQRSMIFPVVIIDTGTADTFDFINSKGIHIGGFITPGLTTMAKSLEKFTCGLKEVIPEDGELKVGKNTEDAMKFGIYTEWVTKILAFVKMSEKVIGKSTVIVCGGNSPRIKDYIKDAVIDEDFLLKAIYEYSKDI